ncbi:MAG: PAS domain S-box protein [Leptolyngbyaceae cyanobacterium SM2_3_12]|nr:PAS domain S-box protein [Leptolyngbyaceae cyanobacterium SM2_3_12]
MIQTINHTIATGEPYQIEYRIHRLDGAIRWIAVWGIVAPDLYSLEPQMIGVVADISDRKQAELERELLLQDMAQMNRDLEQANQQLEDYSQTLEHRVEERAMALKAVQQQIIAQEKLASLGTLTAGIAHELRNPLNFVTNYARGSIELSQELLELLQPVLSRSQLEAPGEVQTLIADLQENATTIYAHSQRAEKIISNMMQQLPAVMMKKLAPAHPNQLTCSIRR